MKATYEATIKVKVIHDIGELTDLKSDREFSNDLVQMICDEAVQCGAVATYEIIESSVDVK